MDAPTTTRHQQAWLLVPGGLGTRQEVYNTELLSALRQLSAHASLVMSVCTGAALLAAAGLLEGQRATSNKTSWVRSARLERVGWVVLSRTGGRDGGQPRPGCRRHDELSLKVCLGHARLECGLRRDVT